MSAFVAMALAAPGTAAAGTAPLTPVTKWWLDYAADSCRLVRAFGEGDGQIVAQFIRYEPSDHFSLILTGKPLAGTVDHAPVQLRFGETGAFVRRPAMTGSTSGKQTPALFLTGRLDNLDPLSPGVKALAHQDPYGEVEARLHVSPETEAAATTLTLRIPGRAIVLALGSMGPPMAAMRQCTSDLVKEWGLDPTEQASLATHPRPRTNPGTWVRAGDYPWGPLASGQQAIISFRLAVDATGQTTACAIQSSIASDDAFAKTTCELLKKRAQFEPARTPAGKAVASYYVNRVLWVIP
ncbi:hypothetical protein ACFOD9_12885 [Novosphingobium bradum]|uniref:TonB C-terminal domain-containing protein n=1 Tax=Novosphingobium bradum TaxID=1737444 RepID=A0ABV7IWQ5_9SPHN